MIKYNTREVLRNYSIFHGDSGDDWVTTSLSVTLR